MAADLRRFLAYEPIRAKPAGPLLRASKWIRRNPWPVSAIAAVIVVVVAAFALWVKARSDARAALLENARAELAEGDRIREEYDELGTKIAALREEIERESAVLEGHESSEVKLPIWEKEEAARALEADRDRRLDEVVRQYQGGLAILGEDSEASDRLAGFYLERYLEAESAGDRTAMRALREGVERFDGSGELLARIASPTGLLNLETNPAGAEVYVFRYVERYRRLWPCPFDVARGAVATLPTAERAATIPLSETLHVSPAAGASLATTAANRLGATPLREVALPPGSYLLILRREGYVDARYPVLIESDKASGPRAPIPLYLPDVHPDPERWAYVPEGTSIVGGDPAAYGSRPRRQVHVPGFFIMRREVTNEEYVRFLNQRSHFEGDDRAEWFRYAPRLHRREGLRRGTPTFWTFNEKRRRFSRLMHVPPNGSVPGISWEAAAAYAAWRNREAEQLGERFEYALPTEDEWERAARGADGRAFPWGNGFDWTFALGVRSVPLDTVNSLSPVSLYPADESPFGVLDLAGCLREHCSDLALDARWPDRHAIHGGSLTVTSARQMRSATRSSADPGEPNGNFGFRLICREKAR